MPRDGVPKGELIERRFVDSQVFPGTERKYWIYVPAQYDADKPACVMIFQDGGGYVNPKGHSRVPIVFDNLIHDGSMPVTIGIFIDPGIVPPTQKTAQPRKNRSFEYDTLSDQYARFLLDEILPTVGKDYHLTNEGSERAVAGISSGGICAFTVACERPDHFQKVISYVGSFTNIRGGHVYPEKVREADKKDIRVFFQDGRNDNRGERRGGRYDETWDWFKQNVRLVEAMTDKGYDINYSWGIGLHGSKQGGAMLPEMMRWLWRDHGVSTDPTDAVERSFHLAK